MPLNLTITNEQKIKVTLTPESSPGHPAPVDGIPVWDVVSGESTVQPSEDGLSADLISSDNPGSSQIRVRADANMGSGVTTIEDQVSLIVVSPEATSLGLTAGSPEPK